MPPYWYDKHRLKDVESDEHRKLCEKIVAPNKPYFFAYVYPSLRTQDMKYKKVNDMKSLFRFGKTIKELDDNVYAEREQKRFYELGMTLGNNPCLVNRICWLFEKEFAGFREDGYTNKKFDPNILKSGTDYSRAMYFRISDIYEEYKIKTAKVLKEISENPDDYNGILKKQLYIDIFNVKCSQICPDEKMLCDILVDMCYKSNVSKSFVWEICGDVIIENMLEKNGYRIHYPVLSDGESEFTFCGRNYSMEELIVERDNIE